MKHIRVLLLSICIFVSASVSLNGQGTEELMRRMKTLETQIMSEVDKYQQELNKKYSELLGKPWVYTKGEEPRRSPLDKDRPVAPTPYDSSSDGVSGKIMMDADMVDMTRRKYEAGRTVDKVFEEKTGPDDCKISIDFNGIEVSVRCPVNVEVSLAGTSEKEVAEAWNKMTSMPYHNLLRDLSKLREVMSLSDWSFVCLVDKVSEVLYGSSTSDSAVLFQVYILNRFGFLLSLGRSEDGRIHKLMSVDMSLIGYPLYNVDGRDYYLIDKSVHEGLSIVSLGLDGESPIRIGLHKNELFYPRYSEKKHYESKRYPEIAVSVASDMNRMDHYNDYPVYFSDGDVKTSFYYYAMQPLGDDIKAAVYPVLQKAIEGKSEVTAVNMLLNFVQTAFVYEYDEKFWGKERYLYADEIWYYNFSDCEDRSILFSRLVRDLLGLEVALVYWPGHLSCAVAFRENVEGFCFENDGKTYVSCDPTFIGAGAGALMKGVKELQATLIKL